VLDQVILFVASLAANFFSALSGGGAGLIQFPILIFLGLPFGVALATHKVASVALGLGATLRHFRESHLERRFSLIILGAGLPGVVLGAATILQVPEKLATLLLGVLTLSLGLYSIFKPRLGMDYAPRNDTGMPLLTGMAGCSSSGFSMARSPAAPACSSPCG
jgi:uncharacterized protein